MPSSLYQYRPLPPSYIRLLELHPSPNPTAALSASVLTLPLLASPSSPTRNESDNDNPPPAPAPYTRFEALSYAWGDPATPFSLAVPSEEEGVAVTRTIPLTASLRSLLVRVRLPDRPRRLWADAACINQADAREKAAQVGMMDAIYSAAERVLADLGEDPDGEGTAAEQVMQRYWRAAIRRGGDKRGFGRRLGVADTARLLGLEEEVLPVPVGEDGGGGGTEEEEEPLEFSREERLSVLRFFRRPWFQRIWVVQEFVLAREVVLLCGSRELDWRHLLASCMGYEGVPGLVYGAVDGDIERPMSGMMCYVCMAWIRRMAILQRTGDGRRFVEYVSSLSDGRMTRYYGKPSLAQLLHYMRKSRATLGRDRYFALLKIASDVDEREHPELLPDYTAPDDEIVRRFARVLLQKPGAAEVFMRAGLWRGTRPELPSWVEDATQDHTSTLLDLTLEEVMHKAAGETEFVAEIDSNLPNVLIVKACRVDTVQEMAVPCQALTGDGKGDLSVILEYLRHAIMLFLQPNMSTGEMGRTEPYHTGENAMDAAALTVCTYRGTTNLAKEDLACGFLLLFMLAFLPETSQTLDELREIMAHRLNYSEDEIARVLDRAPAIQRYMTELSAVLGMRLTPTVTWGGYFANLPCVAQPGDEVWIVQGCRFPMVLRRNDDEALHGEFRLVGTCYVHGMMNGETLERPGFEFEMVSIC